MNEELGWPGIKAITESMKAVAYPHLVSIRLWKTYIEDEGVRAICELMQKCATVQCLELLDDKVTPLGCEFLGKTLTPGPACPPISILKLDHNAFGSEGLKFLAAGIKENLFLKTLSLTYCDIDQHGARALMEILIFSKSLMEELILTGNQLRNEGTKTVLNGVSIAKNLKKVHLGDNNFNEEEDMLEAIKTCMDRNKTLARYDFRNNDLKDNGK
jgi:Ran GTPase-activating protein (RanGAP) involved in mRNA processing and transport